MKEIKVFIACPLVVCMEISPNATVGQVLERLESLGFKGLSLSAEPNDFRFLPKEELYDRLGNGDVVFAVADERGQQIEGFLI